MQTVKLLAWAIPMSLGTSIGNAAVRSQTTDYCLNSPIDAATGGGGTFPLGHFVMKARLTVTGSRYVLEAWNVMPDNSQILEIRADGTYRRTGPTHIRFIDNFENSGRGSFTATKSVFHIDIDRVSASPEGRNIGRNYGSYDLKSDGCHWDKQ